MTDKNLTEIICIVDRSGSMGSIRDDAIGGFNTFLQEQQKEKVDRCLLTYAQFDDRYEIVKNGIPIEDMPPLTDETFVPRGSTALLDAIGKTVNTVGERLSKTPEEQRPGSVIVVILTDGGENASREFNRQQIHELITNQRDRWQWEFIFLAANQDAIAAGGALGIMNAANFSHDAAGSRGIYENLSQSVRQYRATGLAADLKVDDADSGDPQ